MAGYDLVFTPVKSASLLWALGSAGTRQAVEDAHHEAVADTLGWLEEETAFARIGDAGEQQIETRGFIAAAFDHRDSRAGDPDLHTHLAISNKVRARDDYPDGRARWLSLDARVIHAAAVAASERYNTRFEDALARRLGVAFVERRDSVRHDKRVIREIANVPDVLLKHFSKRRAVIEDRYRALTSDYRHTHGHEPRRSTQLKLAQQATLETRDPKATPASLADKLTAWREEARAVNGASALARLGSDALGQPKAVTSLDDLPVEELAQRVVEVVAAEKATWTRWNVLAEIERQLRPLRMTSPADRQVATDLVLEQALSPSSAVKLTASGLEPDGPPQDIDSPNAAVSRRSNGESLLHEHGTTRYTTQDLLDAEQRLLDLAAQPTGRAMRSDRVVELISAFEQRHQVSLDPGQRTLVHGFTTDPRCLTVGIGPAGAGKTTAMKALAETWRTTGRRVVPLAPSATAAEVLGSELACRAENVHKFRHAHETTPSGRPEDAWFVLEPGDLVLVDEASMVGTHNLDWLTTYARERGALVRLLGDPSQLSSVEAGGMLRLLAHDAGAVELTDLHRFADPDEAAATVDLREGRTRAIDFYRNHNRIRSGSSDAMLEGAYEAWAHDLQAGLTSLLIAQSAGDVKDLNLRARAARVADGSVAEDGVHLHDGTRAGVGDLVVTRRNQRQLSSRDGATFVKNGDTWTVTKIHRNGDLTVRDVQRTRRQVRLPHAYVTTHIELGYATTTARAQGRTVDRAHVLVDHATTRESLYVAATRARAGTHLYLASAEILEIDADRAPAPTEQPDDLMAAAVAREGASRTATEVQRAGSASTVRPVGHSNPPSLSDAARRTRATHASRSL